MGEPVGLGIMGEPAGLGTRDSPQDINRPLVVGEVTRCFADYDDALLTQDSDRLDGWFWVGGPVVRFGVAEELYGPEAIAAYRRSGAGRVVRSAFTRTSITTFGADAATVSAEFEESDAHGRQTQTWIRLPEGWRIVCAHVSSRPLNTTPSSLSGQPISKEPINP